MVYHGTALLAVCVALGALIYGPLRRIPLRAINTAMGALQSSEARYRALVERAPVGIVKYRHGMIEFVNPSFVSLVGAASASEVVGRDFLDFVAREHKGEAAGMIVALSGGAASLPMRRQRLCRRDGSVVETEVAGVSSLENDVWVAQLIIADVSEQRQAQELVRQSRDRLLDQQRALSAIARSEDFADGGGAAVRVLTEVVARQMDVERVSLWRFTPEKEALQCVDLYERGPGRHSEGAMLPVQPCRRFVEAIETEEAMVADDALADELTRDLADSYLRPHDISSVLYVPIRLRGTPQGLLCHEHVGPAISWTPEQRMFAIAAGNLAALALERNARERAEEELRGLRAVR